ncbi:hypothetical protein [Aromatoleum evansii]|uniref:hypothetical protein n=1 Tax=Aromatoleum evansii TaxID=59406 RepID=UPI00145D6BFB|nr:hypothetical protein [Aromatoleum evansii]NMG31885.1 hypothetical protein [Aromatoleum evansii]
MEPEKKSAFTGLLNPVVLIPLIIIFGVFALIGAAIFGIDSGVLGSMARLEFARGLITYLFAVVTIGTAVVLVVSALSSGTSEEIEKRFQRGKEVLSLLLGVFGTIVGFYFGSESQIGSRAESAALPRLTPIMLSPAPARAGEDVRITAAVIGGIPPYRYRLTLGERTLAEQQAVKEGGWIVTDTKAPAVKSPTALEAVLRVTDAAGQATETVGKLEVLPPEGVR